LTIDVDITHRNPPVHHHHHHHHHHQLESCDGGEEAVVAITPCIESDAAVLSAAALAGLPLLPQAVAAARRLIHAVGDLWTVVPPSTRRALGASVDRGAVTEHGDMVQAAAEAASSVAPAAPPKPAGKSKGKGGRRPEAPHGCVVVRDSAILSSGANHTVSSLDAVDPELRPHLDTLQGLVGDHRQWFRAWEARERRGSDASALTSSTAPALERVSFHAEQHAVLRAVSEGA
jgi:hypothetical protein